MAADTLPPKTNNTVFEYHSWTAHSYSVFFEFCLTPYYLLELKNQLLNHEKKLKLVNFASEVIYYTLFKFFYTQQSRNWNDQILRLSSFIRAQYFEIAVFLLMIFFIFIYKWKTCLYITA